MKVAAYEGFVDGERIILEAEVRLPDKTRVIVVVPDAEDERVVRIVSPRLVNPEQIGGLKKEIVETTEDASV
jgi:hypothetical protein